MELFDLFVKLSLNASDFTRSIDDIEREAAQAGEEIGEKVGGAVSTGIKGAGKVLAGLGKITAAGLAAGTTAVAAITKQSTDAYSEYQQLTGGVQLLFKENSDAVIANADKAFKTTGLSANEYLSTIQKFSASLLQSVGGDTVKAADYADMAINDMADNASAMGTNIQSIQNAYKGFAKGTYTMLDNLSLGYGGTQKEMYRLMQDAAAVNEEFAKTADFSMDEKGHLTAGYADIVQAIHIVQENMGIINNSAREADKTITGSVASMKAAYDNLILGLATGEGNLDELTQNLIQQALGAFKNLMPTIISSLKGISSEIGTIVRAVINELPNVIREIIPELLPAVRGILDAVFEIIPELIPTLLHMITEFFPDVVEAVVSLVLLLTEQIPTFVQLIINALVTAAPMLIDAAIAMVRTLVDMLTDPQNIVMLVRGALDIILALADGLIKALPELVMQIPIIIQNLCAAIIESLPLIIGAGIELIISLIMGLTDPKWITELAKTAVQLVFGFVKAIIGTLGSIAEAGTKITQRLKDSIKDRIDALKTLGKDLINSVKEGVVEEAQKLLDFVKGIWDKITGIFKKGKKVKEDSQAELDGLPTNDDYSTPFAGTPDTGSTTTNNGGITINQNIYSQAHTAADLQQEAVSSAKRATLATAGHGGRW